MSRDRIITFCLRASALWFAFGIFFLFGTHACGQTARWVKLPEVRKDRNQVRVRYKKTAMPGPPTSSMAGPSLVEEIIARLPDTSNMRGEDPVGQGHYGAHGINNHARETYGRRNGLDSAAYYPGGWVFIAPVPTRFTLSDVIRRTRTPLPGGEISVPNWNDQPLYIFDELSAYTLGTMAGIESGQAQNARTRSSFHLAGVMIAHAKTTVILARETGYPHTAELTGYVQRVEQLHKKIASRMGGR